MARQFSPMLTGKQLDGIWHTGVRVYGKEYYYGGGICSDVPESTPYGRAERTRVMGQTNIAENDFMTFLQGIAHQFGMHSYHLLENNCNHFSDRCCTFLTGQHIPQFILDLPREALDSPIGPMLTAVIEPMQEAIIQQSASHRLSTANASGAPTSECPKPAATSERAQPPAPAPARCAIATTPVMVGTGNADRIAARLREVAPKLPVAIRCAGDVQAHLTFLSTSGAGDALASLDLLRTSALSKEVGSGLENRVQALLERFVSAEVIASHRGTVIMAMRTAMNLLSNDGVAQAWVDARRVDELDAVVAAIATGLQGDGATDDVLVAKAAAGLARNLVVGRRGCVKHGEDMTVRLLFEVHRRVEKDVQSLVDGVGQEVGSGGRGKQLLVIVEALVDVVYALCFCHGLARDLLDAYGFPFRSFEHRVFDGDANVRKTVLLIEELCSS